MVWYDKKCFDEYFELVSDFEKNSPLRKDSESHPIYTEENVNLYVSRLIDFYEKQFQTEYLRNLIAAPRMNLIIMNLEQHRKFASTHVRKRLLAKIETVNGLTYVPTYAPGAPASTLLHFLTSEFRDYLYLDRILENEKQKKIKQKILECLNLHKEIEILSGETKKSTASLRKTYSERTLENLQIRADNIQIEKYRANHRETIFAENIIRHNRRYYRGPRISLVQELMHLPFFERQLDTSTLNRINRKIQEQK